VARAFTSNHSRAVARAMNPNHSRAVSIPATAPVAGTGRA
jgi:hypothetical protein